METNISVNVSELQAVTSGTTEIPKWAEIFVILFMTLVLLSGVPGNGIIVIVQWKNRDKSSTDVLVTTMAIFLLFCAGFNSVLIILENIPVVWIVIASATFCGINNFTLYVTSISSTLLLTVIALDRYLKTCKPLNTFYTLKKAKWICFGVILASFFVPLPSLFTKKFDPSKMSCDSEGQQYHPILYVLDVFLAAAFFIMFIVVVFCYTKVAILIRRRHHQKAKERLAKAGTSMTVSNSMPASTSSKESSVFFSKKNKIRPHSLNGNLIEIVLPEGNSSQEPRRNILMDGDNHSDILKITIKNNKEVVRIIREESKMVNRTTLIMFLITTIYIMSWALHWVSYSVVSTETLEGRIAIYLMKSLFMVNSVTNPIFFISLSSRFRKKARDCFRRH